MSKRLMTYSLFLMFTLMSSLCIAKTIYVATTGLDTNDGLTWSTAKKTVQAGLNTALSGDEVWVAKGTYVENITMKDNIGLYGGFTGSEITLGQRNFKVNTTVLDGNRASSVVTSPSGLTSSARIDGFTIRNGAGSLIMNNGHGQYFYGGGIYCDNSSPSIANNTIIGNRAQYGGGIACSYSSPVITNNMVIGNGADWGGGIVCVSSSVLIVNNTIAGNYATYGGAVSSANSTLTINNSIIAYNSSAISSDFPAILHSCCVYGNGSHDSIPPETDGNISVDPLFAGREYGNYHLQQGSPCIGKGDDSYIQSSWLDIDGQPRLQDTHVDIGADESDGTVQPVGPYVIVRVAPDGDDTNDGLSWANPKKTVQSAINAAGETAGEVWVKQGTYNEDFNLLPYVYMYGGFAGNETDKSQRDWKSRETVIIGFQVKGSNGSSVTLGHNLNRIDGFTIKGGAGLKCRYCSPVIANNTITGNFVGISASSSSPTIINNVIAENGIFGIFCYECPSVITNNTIVKNGAELTPEKAAIYWGGGSIMSLGSTLYVSNNIIAYNYADNSMDSSGSFQGHSNCIYGNKYNNNFCMGINVDPKLFGMTNGDYRLSPISPCIDAGDSYFVQSSWKDIDGENRINGASVDIGADECYYSTSQIKTISFNDAKKEADYSLVDIPLASGTAKFNGYFYVEDSNRLSGLRVNTSYTWSRNYPYLHITGVMNTSSDGERYIDAWDVKNLGTTPKIKPLALVNQALGGGDFLYSSSTGVGQQGVTGGFGLNNIGLLVTTWGHFTYVDSQTFTLDDGSGAPLDGGSGVTVKCIVPSGVTLNPSWQTVIVTGISSCEKVGDEIHRLLRVRTQNDIIGY